MSEDILVGLRFELSGGVGKMAGQIIGQAGPLYLVQRDGAEHFELLELADLRSARFYGGAPRAAVSRARSVPPPTGATPSDAPSAPAPAPSIGSRLSERIRRSSTSEDG